MVANAANRMAIQSYALVLNNWKSCLPTWKRPLVAATFIPLLLVAGIVPAGAEEVRVIRAGRVTEIESSKQGTIGTAIQTGPITTYEFKGGTKVQSVQMGNVTQYEANDGAKATTITTGPIRTTESRAGTSSTVRVGGVMVSPDAKGPQSVAVQNTVVLNADGGAVSSGEQGIQTAVLIEGSGTSATEKRALGGFSGLSVNGIVAVRVEVGKAVGATVTAEKEILPLLETTVSGDVLKIGFRKSARFTQTPKVEITVPELSRLEFSGSANIQVTGIRGPRLLVEGDGTGEVILSGQTDKLDVLLEGTGNLDARALGAGDGKVTLDGTASAHVQVRDLLTAEIKGVGDVVCHGKPREVRKKVEGVGDCVIVERP
jgi:hypothetical protein